MDSAFLLQLLRSLTPTDLPRLRKFLQSPYFNGNAEALALYERLLAHRKTGFAGLDKKSLFRQIFPDQAYNNRRFNHLLSELTALVERFFTLEEIQSDAPLLRLRHCRALRRRNIAQQFERDLALLEKAHQASPYRHAPFYLYQYELIGERYAWEALRTREAHTLVPAAGAALANFFMLENLRWACTAQSAKALRAGGEAYDIPLSDTVLAASAAVPEAENPTLALLRGSVLTLRDNADETHFQQLQTLLAQYGQLLPPAEARDVFMAGINFAIRRHNRGENAYTRAALDLYRAALDRGVLTENGMLPKYTFINIFNLAQLAGEQVWAREFIDRYQSLLPATDRDNIHRYCLAGWHFRRGDYFKVLELLRAVEFNEVFIHLDVRKMLLRSYFELGEWPALASLLDSFRTYLRRQKNLGYHREGYLNLIRFTKKIAGSQDLSRARRAVLAGRVRGAEFLTEREWLLQAVQRGL